jgi:cytochrome c6
LRDSGFVSWHCSSGAASPLKTLSASVARLTIASIALSLVLGANALAESGADVYKMKCAPCHGSNGAGETMIGRNLKMRSLVSPEVQNQSDAQLANVISQGKNKMPSYSRKLSKDQIAATVKYIRALKK